MACRFACNLCHPMLTFEDKQRWANHIHAAHDGRQIAVYQVNDCDWIAAASLDEATEYYLAMVGSPKDLASGETLQLEREEYLDEPHEVSAEAMGRLLFVDTEAEMVGGSYPTRTYAEQLALEIAQGQGFPCFFASTEY